MTKQRVTQYAVTEPPNAKKCDANKMHDNYHMWK